MVLVQVLELTAIYQLYVYIFTSSAPAVCRSEVKGPILDVPVHVVGGHLQQEVRSVRVIGD